MVIKWRNLQNSIDDLGIGALKVSSCGYHLCDIQRLGMVKCSHEKATQIEQWLYRRKHPERLQSACEHQAAAVSALQSFLTQGDPSATVQILLVQYRPLQVHL